MYIFVDTVEIPTSTLFVAIFMGTLRTIQQNMQFYRFRGNFVCVFVNNSVSTFIGEFVSIFVCSCPAISTLTSSCQELAADGQRLVNFW